MQAEECPAPIDSMAGLTVQEGETVIVDCNDGRKLFSKIKLGRWDVV